MWGWRVIAFCVIAIAGSTVWIIADASAQNSTTDAATGVVTASEPSAAPLAIMGSALITLVGVVALFGRSIATGALVPRQSADQEAKLIHTNEQLASLLQAHNEREADALRREDRLWQMVQKQQPPE